TYLEYSDGNPKVLKMMNGTQITFETPTYQGQAVGRQLLPKEIKDRNGNKITITNAEIVNGGTNCNGSPCANTTHEWAIDYITDSLGRVVDFYYESNLLRQITENRGGTSFSYLTLLYEPVTLTTNFTSPITATDPGGTGPAPNQINGTQAWLPW